MELSSEKIRFLSKDNLKEMYRAYRGNMIKMSIATGVKYSLLAKRLKEYGIKNRKYVRNLPSV